MPHYQLFDKIINTLNLPKKNLRIEKIITTSMNNYVVNINCNGVTWALVMRYPKHADVEKFVKEKERSIAVADYLANLFDKGVPISPYDTFTFIGRSFLADARSVKSFIKQQEAEPPLRILDSFHNQEKIIQGIHIPDEYLSYYGPYFITNGAPANETLEHDFSFAEPFLKSLAVLHSMTGAKKTLSKDILQKKLHEAYNEFSISADSWKAGAESSEEKRIHEYETQFGESYSMYIKREVFLQSNKSTPLLHSLLHKYFGAEIEDQGYHSFVHGDMHGANFIIVQYEYHLKNKKNAFLDRMLLNSIFEEHKEIEKVTIEEKNNTTVYREYTTDDEPNASCIVVKRGKFNEVHLIDIDTGKGITEKEKACYLYDVLVCGFSIMNWSHIHEKPLKDFSLIAEGYVNMFQKTL